MFGRAILCAALVLVTPAASWAQETSQGEGDPYILAIINDFNGTLRSEWMDLRIEQIELFTVGQERMGGRIHRQPFRWVLNDPRRASEGALLSYQVDLSGDLTPIEAEAAIDRAMATWSSDCCLKRMSVVKRPNDGMDADLFDSLFGYGDFGDYRAADVVHAGWLPPDFFEQVTGPGGGESVVALSVTFIFASADGVPTDIDGDGYMDAAHSEIYYNQGIAWTATGAPDGQVDVESVALHEAGHALGVRHVDPHHTAVMNPVYTSPRTRLQAHDHAALCSIWASWGK